MFFYSEYIISNLIHKAYKHSINSESTDSMQEEEDLCKLLISYIDITELHQTLKVKGANSHSYTF